jgi:hypothetical protein
LIKKSKEQAQKEVINIAHKLIETANITATTIIKEANDTIIQIIKEAKDCQHKESFLKQLLFVAVIGCLVLEGGLIEIQTRYNQTKICNSCRRKKLEQTEKHLAELQRKVS